MAQQSSSGIISNDFISLLNKNGKGVKNGTWNDIENHVKYAIWLGEKLGYTKMDDWYKITAKDIFNNYGWGLLNKYRNSPLMFLKGIFPDTEWLPWRFGSVAKGYWNNIQNHIKYAEWLGKTLDYKNMDDWYKLTVKDIRKHRGSGLLADKYRDSPYLFLKSVFPQVEWVPWKRSKVTQNFWNNTENVRHYAYWLGKTLGYENMVHWYQITRTIINNNYGIGCLKKYNSTLMFLKDIFPEYEWLPWLFESTPQQYWNDETQIKFAIWLGKTLCYKNMDDWYQITQKIIQDNKGGGLLCNKYNGSPLMFLKGVFPDYEWLPWKFGMTSLGYWNEKGNHRIYANWLGKTLGYKNMDDWYQINQKIIHDYYGAGLLGTKYNDSPKLFVMTIYREHTWDSSKFVKNYSQGQIEWLNYMILTVPDIIHAINNNNGEYSIPNSKYLADGFSESKNMILEYHGDYWHGNPKLFNQEELNSVTKTTYGELYQKTVEKQKFCQESGYKYISIWESDWIRGKNSIKKLQQKFIEKYCENV